ncbi:hypothetical protein HK100_009964, partial [Physocladia obscura]
MTQKGSLPVLKSSKIGEDIDIKVNSSSKKQEQQKALQLPLKKILQQPRRTKSIQDALDPNLSEFILTSTSKDAPKAQLVTNPEKVDKISINSENSIPGKEKGETFSTSKDFITKSQSLMTRQIISVKNFEPFGSALPSPQNSPEPAVKQFQIDAQKKNQISMKIFDLNNLPVSETEHTILTDLPQRQLSSKHSAISLGHVNLIFDHDFATALQPSPVLQYSSRSRLTSNLPPLDPLIQNKPINLAFASNNYNTSTPVKSVSGPIRRTDSESSYQILSKEFALETNSVSMQFQLLNLAENSGETVKDMVERPSSATSIKVVSQLQNQQSSIIGKKGLITPLVTAPIFLGNPNKNVLPKISTLESKEPKVILVVEDGAFGTKELAQKRAAAEKNIWRYSKMDETRRQVFFMNRLRAKELADRTRQELQKKLKKDEEEEDYSENFPTNNSKPEIPLVERNSEV